MNSKNIMTINIKLTDGCFKLNIGDTYKIIEKEFKNELRKLERKNNSYGLIRALGVSRYKLSNNIWIMHYNKNKISNNSIDIVLSEKLENYQDRVSISINDETLKILEYINIVKMTTNAEDRIIKKVFTIKKHNDYEISVINYIKTMMSSYPVDATVLSIEQI